MAYIKDIAKICNVSVATVSKALNDQPDISETTKERIRAVADELGYMPNSAAIALKTSKTNNIGVLFTDAQGRGLTHDFFSTLLQSVKFTAEQNGYDVTFMNSKQGRTYLQHCRYRGLDGVIIANINYSDKQVEELVESDIPLVAIDHEFGRKFSVMSDNKAGGRAIIEYLYNMGHRKIAVITGEQNEVTKKRLSGIMEFCREKGIEIPGCNIKQSKFHDSNQTYFATREILTQNDRPTCIIFQDDYSYIGGYNAIKDLGLSVPDDISVVGYDGIELSRIMSPRLVTYHQDTEKMGQLAVLKLIEQIDSPDSAVSGSEEVKGNLLDGGSVKNLVNG